MITCGEGNKITLSIGGKISAPSIGQAGHGLTCTGKVAKVTDGRFTITGPMQTGLEVSLGRTAVPDIGRAKIVLSEQRWEPYDPGFLTHAGLDPYDCGYILLKSRQHFRAGFETIAKHFVMVACPGVCNSDYAQFNFNRLRCPIFLLDADMTLDNNPWASKM